MAHTQPKGATLLLQKPAGITDGNIAQEDYTPTDWRDLFNHKDGKDNGQ